MQGYLEVPNQELMCISCACYNDLSNINYREGGGQIAIWDGNISFTDIEGEAHSSETQPEARKMLWEVRSDFCAKPLNQEWTGHQPRDGLWCSERHRCCSHARSIAAKDPICKPDQSPHRLYSEAEYGQQTIWRACRAARIMSQDRGTKSFRHTAELARNICRGMRRF
jgi:hypothetical protein